MLQMMLMPAHGTVAAAAVRRGITTFERLPPLTRGSTPTGRSMQRGIGIGIATEAELGVMPPQQPSISGYGPHRICKR